MEKLNRIKKNKLFKNFMILFTGEGIISVIGMVNLAIIINTIGLEKNGILIMVQTYAMLFNNIFGFKSFQALIKYLAVTIEKNDDSKTKQYIKQSLILDIASVIISVIFGYIFLNVVCNMMGWSNDIKPYIRIFLLATIFYIQGTPIGILRAYNKFDLITYSNVFSNILKLGLYVIALITHQGFIFFFIVEIIIFVFPNILLLIFAYKTLIENKLGDFYKDKSKMDKEFFKFNFYSNITSTIDIPVGTLTTMLINKYLGFTEISVYKIFEKLGSVIGKLGSPLSQIIYPEMSLMIAKKRYEDAKNLSKRLFKGISLIGIGFILVVLLTYNFWLGIFIKDYNLYIVALCIYLAYMIYINATAAIHSLFLVLGYIKYNVPILLIINTIYIPALFLLIKYFSLIGVIIALLLQAVAVVEVKNIIMRKNKYNEKTSNF